MKLSTYLTKQYAHLKRSGAPIEYVNSTWWTIYELNPAKACHIAGIPYRAGRKFRPHNKKLSPSASKKIRRQPIKQGNVLHIWVAHGDASDHLCSRYVGTIWPTNRKMPVPGTKTDMNDSHINCLCEMEFAGFADENTESVRTDRNNPGMPRPPWLDL